MVRLNTSDAAILARVAKYRRRLSPERSIDMLTHAGDDAKIIGNILISQRTGDENEDHFKAANDIREWAGDVRL